MEYTCFDVEIKDKIAHIKMSRPDEFNSMNKAFWSELPHLVESISDDASARVIVLSGEGKHFCAGMDLANFSPSDKQPNAHMGMRKESGYRVTLDLQHTITCLEKASIPVIAAVQGGWPKIKPPMFDYSAFGGSLVLGCFLYLLACANNFWLHMVCFEAHILGYGVLAVTLPSMVSAYTISSQQGRIVSTA